MPIEIFEYKGRNYPELTRTGNAARFVIPFAKEFCKGTGYDIGYGEEDWKLPGAIGIDIKHGEDGLHADNLPAGKVDYIFSSHLLEHLPNWTFTLEYWINHLKPGGVLFLYLPDYDHVYWRPWNNRKHIHVLTPRILNDFLTDQGIKKILGSGSDMNFSFSIVAER
jgi:predicted SAM-dependent methyltransferase